MELDHYLATIVIDRKTKSFTITLLLPSFNKKKITLFVYPIVPQGPTFWLAEKNKTKVFSSLLSLSNKYDPSRVQRCKILFTFLISC